MAKKSKSGDTPIDMTPMIDMTFQLIAFFMFVLNFSQDSTDQRIKLPVAHRAVPIEGATEEPLFLNISLSGHLLVLGERFHVRDNRVQVEGYLKQEAAIAKRNMEYQAFSDPEVAQDLRDKKLWSTVVVRADSTTPYFAVRELVQLCQELGFHKFRMRAMPEEI